MNLSVVLVAPVAPFRGGIARHSHAFAQAFARRKDINLRIVSFSRLFPKMIYPGASDRDPESRVPENLAVDYSIDSINPLIWFKAAAGIARMRPTLVLMPAWTFFVAPVFGTIARALRRRGIPVAMIVHNASDHERSGWKSGLLNWQLAAADGFITHTDELARQLLEAGHDQPVAVTPHPIYSDFPEASGTLPRERALELLCFGLVRHYKGVDIALQALAAAELGNVRLTIAGEVWDDREKICALIESPGLRGKVELIDRYVSDADTAELFARCDAVLAPYRAVTGSGVAALARHYRRPVIVPDLPGFRGTVEHGNTGWIFPAGDDAALAKLLRIEVTRKSASAMQTRLKQAAVDDGWQAYCQSVLGLADQIGNIRGGDA